MKKSTARSEETNQEDMPPLAASSSFDWSGWAPFDENSQITGEAKITAAIKFVATVCYVLAWACILFVAVWKIVDTSYLFRERDDPSMFDKVTDYFGYDSKWPFAKMIDNGKDTYRVYFFIMPFFLGFLFLSAKGVLTT